MADKSFGVKELNLLNASGTPTVTSPNNLNLNANTVAISTSCTIGSNLTVSGDIDVDGHTNLDNVSIAGVTTFGNNITASGTSRFEIASMENALLDGEIAHTGDTNTLIKFPSNDNISFDTSGTTRLNINNSGATVTGILTATTFSGDPSNDSPHSSWDVVNNSASSYRFTGPGQDGAEDNPDIYLVRGQRYVFKMNASGHPFQIRVANAGACLLYTSPSPRDRTRSRMPSSA